MGLEDEPPGSGNSPELIDILMAAERLDSNYAK
jgi:hypothetical protein